MDDSGLFETQKTGDLGSLGNWRSRIVGHDRVDPRELIANPKNHRTHPQKQRDVVRDSIAEFGVVKSLVVNRTTGLLVDGHERMHQALEAQKTDPNIRVDVEYVELSPAEEAAVLAILDASTDMAVVDPVKLDALLRDVNTGSEAISQMLSELAEASGALQLDDDVYIEDIEPQFDRAAELQQQWGTSEGQLWIIEGKQTHRLLCGDSTKREDVERLMDGEKAVICFTSPPYTNQRTYNQEGDLSTEYLARFIPSAKDHVETFAVNLGMARHGGYLNRYWDDYIFSAENCGLGLLSWNIWDRSERGGGSVGQLTAMFPIEHEFIFVFGKSAVKLVPTVANKSAGSKGASSRRNADGVAEKVTGAKSIRSHRELGTVLRLDPVSSSKDHPAQFPVELAASYIRSFSGGVYEPFAGSGTTLIAGDGLDRMVYAMEISPKYVAVILQRMTDAGCVCTLEQ